MRFNGQPVFHFADDGTPPAGTPPTATKNLDDVPRFSQNDVNRIIAERVGTANGKHEAAINATKADYEAKLAEAKKQNEALMGQVKELEPLKSMADEFKALKAREEQRSFNDELIKNGCKPEHADRVRVLLNHEKAIPEDKTKWDWKAITEKAKEIYPNGYAASTATATGGLQNSGKPATGATGKVDPLAQFRHKGK